MALGKKPPTEPHLSTSHLVLCMPSNGCRHHTARLRIASTPLWDKKDTLARDDSTFAQCELGSWALTWDLYANQDLYLSLLQEA